MAARAATQEYSLTENPTVYKDCSDPPGNGAENSCVDSLSTNASGKPRSSQPYLSVNTSCQHDNGNTCNEDIQARRFSNNQSTPMLEKHDKTYTPGKRKSSGCLKDKYFLANIRTAVMLFVVTVAFIIAYLPSWLMAFQVIDFNVIIFYVYFSNHIVNPIIYAFMNPAFRRSLKDLLVRSKTRGACV